MNSLHYRLRWHYKHTNNGFYFYCSGSWCWKMGFECALFKKNKKQKRRLLCILKYPSQIDRIHYFIYNLTYITYKLLFIFILNVSSHFLFTLCSRYLVLTSSILGYYDLLPSLPFFTLLNTSDYLSITYSVQLINMKPLLANDGNVPEQIWLGKEHG